MSRLSWVSRWTSPGTVAVAVALAASGCAKQGTVQAGPNHVIVTAADYSFSGPDTISAGLEMVHLVNRGPSLHHLQIVELLQGKTLADFTAAMKNPGPPPAWLRWVGGPNAAAPSGVDTAVVYVTLTPGSYLLICVIPDSTGMPHFAYGMVRPLTVTASAATPAAEPQADVVIHLKDYDFAITGTLTTGPHNVRIVNDGPQPHEILIAAMAPGKKAGDLVTWIDAGMRGTPPAKPIGGATALAAGEHQTLALDLAAGDYGLFCFVSDAKDGKEHVRHGMIKDVKVS
jgi:hypothetical protein